jgi:hypothetical protein
MIDQETGLPDQIAIAAAAKARAEREFGGINPPPCYLREATAWCQDRAAAMARAWRRERGLPVEESLVLMAMPAWGASGDSFR